MLIGYFVVCVMLSFAAAKNSLNQAVTFRRHRGVAHGYLLRVWTVGFQSSFTLFSSSEKNVRPLAVLCVAACMHDHVRPTLTLFGGQGKGPKNLFVFTYR